MYRLFKFRYMIKTKILIALSSLSIVAVIFLGYISYKSMNNLGKHALSSNISLGQNAIMDSTNALETQAKEYLLHLTNDQARITNILLENVENEVNIIATFANRVWSKESLYSLPLQYSQENNTDSNCITNNFIYNANNYILAPNVHLDDVKEDLHRLAFMKDIFIPSFTYQNNLFCIYMGTESGVLHRYPYNSGYDKSYDHRKRVWYKDTRNISHIRWTELYISASTGELMITCAKAVFNDYGKIIGVVGADVTLESLNKNIINLKIGTQGYALLIDKKGNIIAKPHITKGNKKWDEDLEVENLFEDHKLELNEVIKDIQNGKSGIEKCNFSGENKYISYSPVSSAKLTLVIIMPLDEIIASSVITEGKIVKATNITRENIKNEIYNMHRLFFICLIFIMVLILTISYLLAKKITGPIQKLEEGARIVGKGNLDHKLSIITGDEIEDLANTFNKMVNDLKIHIERLKKTTEAKKMLESELKIARDIQHSMLPRLFPPFPNRKDIEIYATMNSAKQVGGDFFDYFFVTKNKLCFFVGDVSGKGIPAALFMVISKTLLKTEALRGRSPNKVFSAVNDILLPDNDTCMFFTGFCAILDTRTGVLEYANAGTCSSFFIYKRRLQTLRHSRGVYCWCYRKS